MLMNAKQKEEYYKKGQTWENEIVANAIQSKNRAWIIASASIVLAVLCIFCLLLLLPLKTFEPYVITVDQHTGYTEVTKGLLAGNLTQDQAITEANLVKYLSLREQYNPAVLEKNYNAVILMSGESALKQYQELWSKSNPDNPSVKLQKKASIDIKIKSVSFINDRIASVRFLKELRQNDRVTESHWNAVIEFQYSQKPMRMKERFSNPLGFQVVSYRVNPEVLETIR